MKTILILHGINGHSGNYWQAPLAKEAEALGYNVIIPDLPTPRDPERFEWIKVLKQLVVDVDLKNLIIVGHSLGVPAGLDLVDELNEEVLGFISVAGFYKPYGLELNEEYMSARNIDILKVKNLIKHKYVIRSLNDPYVEQTALRELADDLEANDFVIRDGKHFQHGEYEKDFGLVNFLVGLM